MSHAAVRSVLLAVLLVGAVGGVGTGTTYGLFTNAHDGIGTVSAADDINGGSATADAGGPYTVTEGETVELDASGSTTSNGNIQSYDWQLVTSAGDDSVSPTSGQQVTYNAPADVSEDTIAEVEVTVTDNQGTTDTDTATVTATDSSCDTASLAFCSVDVTDRDTSYSVPYEVGDPNGEFGRIEVTLERSNNGNVEDTASSTSTADTLSVSDNGNMNDEYTIRVELYDTSGAVVECREAAGDTADGTDPTVSDC